MPVYATVPPVQLDLGDITTVWSAETPTPGATLAATSVPVALPVQGVGNPQNLSVSIAFSGAPGAFEVDLLTADVDAWTNYVQKATVTAVNASNVARMEITGLKAKFACLQLVSRANSVSATATIAA
jgi:hypothetical protein